MQLNTNPTPIEAKTTTSFHTQNKSPITPQSFEPNVTFTDVMKAVTGPAPAPGPTDPPVLSDRMLAKDGWILEDSAMDPEKAAMFADMFAYDSLSGPLIDVTDWPIVRLAETGEIYTEERAVYYWKVQQAAHPGRVHLYETELAKGTPPLKILEKIFAYNDALPNDYKRMLGW